VVAARGTRRSGGAILDQQQRLFDSRWKEGAIGPSWAGRTGPKGQLGQLDAVLKMEWTSWAEMSRWTIIED
jgi:hypothetical protein